MSGDACTDTDDDGSGNPGFSDNNCMKPLPIPWGNNINNAFLSDDIYVSYPSMPNGPLLGTYTQVLGNIVKGTGVSCNSDGGCGSGEICQMDQEDCNENDIGDVCECYANYEDESFIDGDDLNLLKSKILEFLAVALKTDSHELLAYFSPNTH